MTKKVFPGTCRSVRRCRHNAFTLIELVLVVGIIMVLAGLVLTTVGYARKKGARARAETEIAAMSAACENYKADNGIYPRGNADLIGTSPYDTDRLNAQTNGNPASSEYQRASLYLYKQLSGDLSGNQQATGKSYLTFKPQMLSIDGSGNVTAIKDPFSYAYGYSTANQLGTGQGYNPTFDLWSTAGLTANPSPPPSDTITPQWIKNW